MSQARNYTWMVAWRKSKHAIVKPCDLETERRRMMASLQSRLDEFKKAFESGAPPYNAPREVIEKMHRATAELKASGLENKALKVGDRAPEFSLFNIMSK